MSTDFKDFFGNHQHYPPLQAVRFDFRELIARFSYQSFCETFAFEENQIMNDNATIAIDVCYCNFKLNKNTRQ